MIEKNEVKRLIEEGLKESMTASELTPINISSEKEAADEPSKVIYMAEASCASGAMRVSWNLETTDFALEFSSDSEAADDTFQRVSLWRVDEEKSDQKDIKSIINDFDDAIRDRFVKKVKIGADGVKMPIPVSRSDVKNSGANFDAVTLATRFATIYPEYKENVKENIASYGGTFLPEEFFTKVAAPKVLNVIRSGKQNEVKKLVGLFNEMYDDGSSEVQEIISVTLLGQLDNDPKLLSVIDEYMDESLKKSVHNVNSYLNKGLGKKKKAILQNL